MGFRLQMSLPGLCRVLVSGNTTRSDSEHASDSCLETSLKHAVVLPSGPLTGAQQIIGSAVDSILKKYMKPLTLEELAQQAHLSPAYFSYLFSRERGQTFTEFLASTRLNKAKELLASGSQCPISDIASQVGYDDANYFSRVFKKNIGMTPTSYRKKVTAAAQ